MTERKSKKGKKARSKTARLRKLYEERVLEATRASDAWAGSPTAADKLRTRNAIISAATTLQRVERNMSRMDAIQGVSAVIAAIVTGDFSGPEDEENAGPLAERVYRAIGKIIFDVDVAAN